MNLFDLLKGKKVKVLTNMNTEAILEIKEVIKNVHSEELEPGTPQNDWWPKTRDWNTYTVKFTNGADLDYASIEEIEVFD